MSSAMFRLRSWVVPPFFTALGCLFGLLIVQTEGAVGEDVPVATQRPEPAVPAPVSLQRAEPAAPATLALETANFAASLGPTTEKPAANAVRRLRPNVPVPLPSHLALVLARKIPGCTAQGSGSVGTGTSLWAVELTCRPGARQRRLAQIEKVRVELAVARPSNRIVFTINTKAEKLTIDSSKVVTRYKRRQAGVADLRDTDIGSRLEQLGCTPTEHYDLSNGFGSMRFVKPPSTTRIETTWWARCGRDRLIVNLAEGIDCDRGDWSFQAKAIACSDGVAVGVHQHDRVDAQVFLQKLLRQRTRLATSVFDGTEERRTRSPQSIAF